MDRAANHPRVAGNVTSAAARPGLPAGRVTVDYVRNTSVTYVVATATLVTLTACSSPTTVDGTAPTGQSATSQPSAATSESTPDDTVGGTPAPQPTGSQESQPATSDSAAQPAVTYRNDTWGYQLVLPSGWQQTSELPDGRGAAFDGPESVTMQVYGSNNIFGDGLERVCADQAEALGEGADRQVDGNRCTITATSGSTTRRLVNWVGAGSLNTLDASFPSGSDAGALPAIDGAVAGFTPGDLASQH